MTHSLSALGAMLWNTRDKFSTLLLVSYTILTQSFYLGLLHCKINFLKIYIEFNTYFKYIFYRSILASTVFFNSFVFHASKFFSIAENILW